MAAAQAVLSGAGFGPVLMNILSYTEDAASWSETCRHFKATLLQAQTIARACGKSHLHNLEPEDLCALTMEAAAMAQVPLAGTDWYPGKAGF